MINLELRLNYMVKEIIGLRLPVETVRGVRNCILM